MHTFHCQRHWYVSVLRHPFLQKQSQWPWRGRWLTKEFRKHKGQRLHYGFTASLQRTTYVFGRLRSTMIGIRRYLARQDLAAHCTARGKISQTKWTSVSCTASNVATSDWCFEKNCWCLMFWREIWCLLGCCCWFCFPRFLFFQVEKLYSSFISFFHQSLTLSCVCYLSKLKKLLSQLWDEHFMTHGRFLHFQTQTKIGKASNISPNQK